MEQQPTSEVKPEAFSYLQGFESRMEEIQKKELERKIMIINAIHEYTTYSTAKFLTKENLLILHENIDHLASGQSDLYKPIRSKMETPLTSPSLRHFVWNIGERLGISLSERANFIKTIFPNELKNATLGYLVKNLKDTIHSQIPIDSPKYDDFKFDYTLINKAQCEKK